MRSIAAFVLPFGSGGCQAFSGYNLPEKEVNPLEDEPETVKPHAKTKEPSHEWWLWLVSHVKRNSHERRAKKKDEKPEQRAARWTMLATIWIGVFTAVLAGAGFLQWKEMDESGAQTDRMIRLYRGQVAQLSKQAGDTHDLAARTKDLADRMKDQADQTKTIADQAVIQANAARSAAETAGKALHVSERAYVVAGYPSMNLTSHLATVPIINSGHIPSGKVLVIAHEVTIPVANPDNPRGIVKAIEVHWKHYTFESVPTTGETLNINVVAPSADADQIKSGHQQIIIVGVISYKDGFTDDPEEKWPFCFGNSMNSHSKDLQWATCDSALYLTQAIATDHYPQDEYEPD
jgi:hypothetical protein